MPVQDTGAVYSWAWRPCSFEVDIQVLVCFARWHGEDNWVWLVVWNIWIIFPYIGNNHPNWLIFLRGVQTTNQWVLWGNFCHYDAIVCHCSHSLVTLQCRAHQHIPTEGTWFLIALWLSCISTYIYIFNICINIYIYIYIVNMRTICGSI